MKLLTLLTFLAITSAANAGSIDHHSTQLLTSKNFQCVIQKFAEKVRASSAVIRLGKVTQGKVIVDKQRSDDLETFSQTEVTIDIGWQQLGDGGEGFPMGKVKAVVQYEEYLVSNHYKYSFAHIPHEAVDFKIDVINLNSCNGDENVDMVN